MSRGLGDAEPQAKGTRYTAADVAWERLQQLRGAAAESRSELAALKAGCAGIVAWLRHGRRGYARQAV